MRHKDFSKLPALLVILLAPWLIVSAVQAEDLDPASTEALLKTQELLMSPALRNEAVSQSRDAKLMDDHVKGLAGSGPVTEQIYGVSSAVFADIVKETGGDVLKMKDLLLKAKNDPKAFYDRLSPENKKALRDISEKISNRDAPSRAPANLH